ncbi:MAG: DUF2293 domain-containing protein [Acidimicrobiales bacterium]
MEKRDLGQRVRRAAGAPLGDDRDQSVSPFDVLVGIGWLPQSAVDRWRQGRIDCLEDAIAVEPVRARAAVALLDEWAAGEGLQHDEIAYVARTRDHGTLRFSRNGDADVERRYRTRWVSSTLSVGRRRKLTESQSRPPDLVVISALRDWECTECSGTGELLFMEGDGPLCLECAELDHLVFLPAGDAALTRRAKKASGLSAVVVRFGRARRRYERRGILVEDAALASAEEQCLADEEARRRRQEREAERRAQDKVEFQEALAHEIMRRFPGCPAERANAIARQTGARRSGRVGRSSAGRALDPDAITRAVAAAARHTETDYDDLLMSGLTRPAARERVRSKVDSVLDSWRAFG